ncbi:GNAT family N-acetyltransferase [Oryzobacter terrae]|uniref:GNAT family N-acetyltransferase n=1 Tax=Oryzobacter terrae TaxID=1620385 RepID=UPI003671D382
MVAIHRAPTRELDAETLHDVLRLRQDVFVLEQECLYPDLDGRDLDPGTVQVWAEDAEGGVVATLRILQDGGPARIGRVVTAMAARGQGIAAAMMAAALDGTQGPVVLEAQSHLAHWYEGLGFVVVGDEYLDDGIPHVPMRLDR